MCGHDPERRHQDEERDPEHLAAEHPLAHHDGEVDIAGAGGVLIILRMLPREQLEALIEQALALNLFSLLEAFDEQDIELAHVLAERYAARANIDRRIRLLVGHVHFDPHH